MRNLLKATTLESKFPLLAVEGGCIISKDADITVVYRVELPELFTVTSAEYEAIHAAWCKALKVLPEYSVVHKQDWFIRERYRPATGEGDMSFLSRSYERHFNERPFLTHACFLYLTKTTRERMHMRSDFSTLCRGNIIPKEVNRESATKFLEAAEQFERILNDSGFLALVRLTGDEITGTADCPGLLERYFSLSLSETTSLQDIELGAEVLRVGNKRVCLHTLSDTEDLPGRVGTDTRYERLSTDRSDCLLSFAAPVGLLLSCDHLYNQYVFLEDSDENLRMFEKRARNMQSLSRYSRGNQINKEWIDQYLNEAHSFGLQSVRAHFNVLAWSDDVQELRHIRNDVGSQLALMECRPRHNTVDAATLYWAGMPGNAGDFPAEESFYTFIEPAVCFFTEETNYKSSSSPFGIKLCDRVSGRPLHLDISDEPMKKGIITNRNKFVLGGSGSGKSFFMNHLVRQYWEQGTHVVLVDTGNSYQGLCELIRRKTKGEDGVYFTYTENKELFPVVTIIIMEAFINKMRRLKGVRKQLIVEEAWKALSTANMAEYLRYMYKTVRKYYGEAIVVTQEVEDIISSPVVKEAIINNSDCKILLDQRKFMNRFDAIQSLLGLTDKEKAQILSINQSNDPSRKYKEVWIGLGGVQSAVYATEVSVPEYLAYTTEETEKVEVQRLAGELGGDMELAIRQLAEGKR